MPEDTTVEPLELDALWVYLSGSPLVALSATLVCYLAASALFERSGRFALLNPVLVSVTLLVLLLRAAEIPYREYFDGAQFVHFLLGPATVALALPLIHAPTSAPCASRGARGARGARAAGGDGARATRTRLQRNAR